MAKEHPNAALAQKLWVAVAEGNADAVCSLLADDVVWRSFGRNPLSGEYKGPEGVLEYLAQVGETSDLVLTLDDILASDQGAVITYNAKAARGVKRLEMSFVLIMRAAKGKVANVWVVPTDQYRNDRFWN